MPTPCAVIRMPSEAAPRSSRVSASIGNPTWIGPPTNTDTKPAYSTKARSGTSDHT